VAVVLPVTEVPFKVNVPITPPDVTVTDPAELLQVVEVVLSIVKVAASGTAFTVTAAGVEIQEMPEVLFTKMLCEPALTPVKVTEA
jgi:hypothetical protein